jgi:hypothetical protein
MEEGYICIIDPPFRRDRNWKLLKRMSEYMQSVLDDGLMSMIPSFVVNEYEHGVREDDRSEGMDVEADE